MNQISNFGVFFLNLVLVDLSMHYFYQLLQEKGAVPERRFLNIVRIGIAISGVILLSNLFTNWMYYFDESNNYHRNTGWYICLNQTGNDIYRRSLRCYNQMNACRTRKLCQTANAFLYFTGRHHH